MKDKFIPRFWSGMAGYIITLFGSIALFERIDSLPLQIFVVLTPMIPLIYALNAIFQQVRAEDELMQRINLESILAMAMIVGAVSFGWGLLEAAEIVAPLPTILIGPSMIGTWGVMKALIGRRYN